MSLPFLSLIPVGFSRYRNPRKADIGLPGKGAQIDEEALFEFLERRVRRGILRDETA